MTDQPSVPSTPNPAPPLPTVTTPVPVVAPLTFWQRLKQDFLILWSKDRLFLIVFGVLIIAAKFSGALMDLIAKKSRKDVEQAKEQDAALKAKEDSAKSQAQALIDDADKIGNNLPPVDENWNVKK
jgi:hypothetical protein